MIQDLLSSSLPDTFSELREHAYILQQEKYTLQQEVTLLKKKLETEKFQNDWFRRQLFGKKSERHISTEPARQMDYLPGCEPTPAEKKPEQPTVVVAEHKRKAIPKKKEFPWNAGVSGLRFNESVDIEVVTCENPAIKDLSPDQYEVLGVETVDKLCQRKSSYFVRRYERPRIKIKETKKIVEPPPSPSVIRGSFMEPEFLAGIVVDKILYHLPLYRIHQRLKDSGIWIARSSLTNAFHAVGDLLQPIFHHHLESILASATLLADETKVKVGIDVQKHKMHTAYFWGLLGDRNEVAFLSHQSRAHNIVPQILSTFSGTLVTDDYAAYRSYAEKTAGIIHALCWAHTRRYFDEAKGSDLEKSSWVLDRIRELYSIESQIREKNLTDEKKLGYRTEHSRPIVDDIFDWLLKESKDTRNLPKSPLMEGVRYALDNETGLRQFLKNSEIPLDTNALERGNKAIATGRKNWLFCTTEIGSEYVALFHSLLFSARLLGIDPYEYLICVLQNIRNTPTENLRNLTPRIWKENRSP